MHEPFQQIDLFAFDIDGTLTDGSTTWLGDEIGWVQTYSVRDGEALLRMKSRGVEVLPLSRNKTKCARVRFERLGLDLDYLGVDDKMAALAALSEKYGVAPARMLYVGDGIEDAAVLEAVGVGCAVADAHPKTRAAARYVTQARGGQRVIEELADLLFSAKGWTA